MSQHIDLVVSRHRNMLTRISAKDTEFEDLCVQHADMTTKIRSLNPREDPSQADDDQRMRRQRAAIEDQMQAIMQSNTRV